MPSPSSALSSPAAYWSGWPRGRAGHVRQRCACSVAFVRTPTRGRSPRGSSGCHGSGSPAGASPSQRAAASTTAPCVTLPATDRTMLEGAYCARK